MPQREILWNVPGLAVDLLYALSALSMGWIAFWFLRRSRLWARGSEANDQLDWGDGVRRLLGVLLSHRMVRGDRYAFWMHLSIFWGFVVLLLATTLVGIQHHTGLVFLVGNTYLVFSLGADLGGLTFCIGIGMALWRRRRGVSTRLLPAASTTILLWLLLVIAVSGFALEAARIVAWDMPAFEVWSPVGYVMARAFTMLGMQAHIATGLHLVLWLGHAALVIVFFVLVPVTLLKHILLGAYSVARPAGRPGLLHEPAEPVLAGVDFSSFRKLDLLQADACLTCGLCTQVCPAEAAGKPLSPRSVILNLRAHLDDPGRGLSQRVADDVLWSCTTCNACDTVCPVNIHVVEKIVTLRRGRVAAGELPATVAEALESTAQKFNPFGRANSARMEWASGLGVPVAREDEPVELLYWVGCAGAFDPAGQQVAHAMIKILTHLKINYRVLGCNERCSGDPARRLGEEGLWKELATSNQAAFARHSVKTVLTHCPHCFHSFQNEYVGVGPMPRVLHHSQWLREKIAEGALKLRSGAAEKITFHDPCYLSRANDETEAPRRVLDQIYNGQRTEMEKHGKQSFCCGGGGGQIWLDVRGRTRVETIRAAQVEATGAQTVATGCPFCRVMLEAGRSSLDAGQGKWRVQDIAELVVENLLTEARS
jgi:Fe-S oxidoreductase